MSAALQALRERTFYVDTEVAELVEVAPALSADARDRLSILLRGSGS